MSDQQAQELTDCRLCGGKGYRRVAGASYSEPCGCWPPASQREHTIWAMYEGESAPRSMRRDTREDAVEYAKAVVADPPPSMLWLKVFRSDNESYEVCRWHRPVQVERPDEPTSAEVQAAALALWETSNERLGVERDREVIGEYVHEAEAALRAAAAARLPERPDEGETLMARVESPLATGKMVEAAVDSYVTSTGNCLEGAMEGAINAALAARPVSSEERA